MKKKIVVFLLLGGVCIAEAAYGDCSGYMPPALQARADIKWVRPICVQKNRYIGWPSVCRLKNGDIIAAFSGDRARHVCPYGVNCRAVCRLFRGSLPL